MGQKIVEAVELGKESDLRSLGPYHQESIGGSFGPNGYNVAGRNAAASQNTDEFNRSVLFYHDLVGQAENPESISHYDSKEKYTRKPRWSVPFG